MATLANAVDPGDFAKLVFASLVETARAKPAKRRGTTRSDKVDDTLYIAPTVEGFSEQYRTAVDHAIGQLAATGIAADPDRQALYAIVDKLLPDVRTRHLERKIEQLLAVLADTHDPMAEFHTAVAARQYGHPAALHARGRDAHFRGGRRTRRTRSQEPPPDRRALEGAGSRLRGPLPGTGSLPDVPIRCRRQAAAPHQEGPRGPAGEPNAMANCFLVRVV